LLQGNFLGFVEQFFPSFQSVNYYTQPQFAFTNYTATNGAPLNKGHAWCVSTTPKLLTGWNLQNPPSNFAYNCELWNGSPSGPWGTATWGQVCSPKPTISLGCTAIAATLDPFGGDPTNSSGQSKTRWLTNDTAFWVASNPATYPYCYQDNSHHCYYVLGLTPLHTEPYNATYTDYFAVTLIGETYTNTTDATGLLSFMGFIAGAIIMLVLALGVGFNATFLVSASPNAQGTKLAQVVGFALLTFNPFYAEFGSWISALWFGTPLLFVLITIFGIGVFWRSMSLD
jgi:hypothetical protein